MPKIVVPELGESVVEATVGRWLKKEGERVQVGEAVVELETDKVDLEVGAEREGVLKHIERPEGENVKVGEVLAVVEDSSAEAAGPPQGKEEAPEAKEESKAAVAPALSEEARPASKPTVSHIEEETAPAEAPAKRKSTPLARRMAEQFGIDLNRIPSSEPGGRVRQRDVEDYVKARTAQTDRSRQTPQTPEVKPAPPPAVPTVPKPPIAAVDRSQREERVRMSRRRLTIARRLVEAQHNAAMLTTFNEIDMSAVMELRKRVKESFQKRHGVSLGIVSFFVKGSIAALKDFPRLNAEVQNDEMVYKNYYDIGVAIGASEGLVVPVLRDADRMTFAEIETAIKQYVQKAEEGKLSLDDLRGGSFTITNGGVFGSLLSTPILNPPQVGILGLHRIQERPVSHQGQVVVHPMMYVALSYDHRIVDGMEAVQFLVRVKEFVEDPASLLLEA